MAGRDKSCGADEMSGLCVHAYALGLCVAMIIELFVKQQVWSLRVQISIHHLPFPRLFTAKYGADHKGIA